MLLKFYERIVLEALTELFRAYCSYTGQSLIATVLYCVSVWWLNFLTHTNACAAWKPIAIPIDLFGV